LDVALTLHEKSLEIRIYQVLGDMVPMKPVLESVD